MNRSLMTALTLSSILAVPAFAGAGDHRGGPPPEDADRPFDGEFGERLAEHQAERLTRALNLTAEQQATLTNLQHSFADSVRPLFETMRSGHDELEALLDGTNPDPAAVGAKAIALHRTKEAMKAAHDTLDDGIEAMLNETQRAQYQALRDARPDMDHFRGRFEGRHH